VLTHSQTVHDLEIWQKSIELVERCYRLSIMLPLDERFALTSQIRRAATSIPANIAGALADGIRVTLPG
jgi:four helix bundle protein